MAAEQNMTQTLTQTAIKAAKTVIIAVRESEILVSYDRQIQTTLKRPTFDWKAIGKYQELCNFEIEVKNTF